MLSVVAVPASPVAFSKRPSYQAEVALVGYFLDVGRD